MPMYDDTNNDNNGADAGADADDDNDDFQVHFFLEQERCVHDRRCTWRYL